MVEIRSLSRHESELAGYLRTWMGDHGFRAQIDNVGNAIGSIGDLSAARTIVLLGHMDTVPGEVPVREEGDLLYGRGTVDAKGPLATFIVAAANAALPPGVRVEVVGAVEEECTTSRGARAVAERYRPDACFIGEPSTWRGVTIGYKGRLVAEYRVTRASAHSAGPNPTASDDVVHWWMRALAWVEARNAGHTGAFDRIQASIRSISSSASGLEDQTRLEAGFRLPPGVPPQELESALRELAGEGVLNCTGAEVAYLADRSNAVVRALGGAIRAEGQVPSVRVKTGTADMNVVGPRWNCPIAAYGPGDSSLDHTPNEHISLTEYLDATCVLTRAIENLAAELAVDLRPQVTIAASSHPHPQTAH